jgi:hypothetical protein
VRGRNKKMVKREWNRNLEVGREIMESGRDNKMGGK